MLWAINQAFAHALRQLQGKGSTPGDVAKLCLEPGDEARQQPEEAAMVAAETGEGNKTVVEKNSKAGVSHWRQDLTTASLAPPEASSLLQDPKGCQLTLPGEKWLLAEIRRENRNLRLNCRNEKGTKSRSWFLGCHKQRDFGQGEKSPGGAGMLHPLGDRLMWTAECRCVCKSHRHETPIVKRGGKHPWHRIQAAEPASLVAAATSAHVA